MKKKRILMVCEAFARRVLESILCKSTNAVIFLYETILFPPGK